MTLTSTCRLLECKLNSSCGIFMCEKILILLYEVRLRWGQFVFLHRLSGWIRIELHLFYSYICFSACGLEDFGCWAVLQTFHKNNQSAYFVWTKTPSPYAIVFSSSCLVQLAGEYHLFFTCRVYFTVASLTVLQLRAADAAGRQRDRSGAAFCRGQAVDAGESIERSGVGQVEFVPRCVRFWER